MQSMLEFLLNQERVQDEIQRDSISGSISCKKKVTFNKSVFVYLIPMVKEFEEAEKSAKAFKRKKSSKANVKERKEVQTMRIDLDINKMTMKNVLALKKILSDHPGGDAVDLHFISEEKFVGCVSIDPSFGVRISEDLKYEIKQLTYAVDLIV